MVYRVLSKWPFYDHHQVYWTVFAMPWNMPVEKAEHNLETRWHEKFNFCSEWSICNLVELCKKTSYGYIWFDVWIPVSQKDLPHAATIKTWGTCRKNAKTCCCSGLVIGSWSLTGMLQDPPKMFASQNGLCFFGIFTGFYRKPQQKPTNIWFNSFKAAVS